MDGLSALSSSTLLRLAAELERGALRPPFVEQQLSGYLPGSACLGAARALGLLLEAGGTVQSAVLTLKAMVSSRSAVPSLSERIALVTSGPSPQAEGRETSVVVRELFESAERSVLVVGFTAKKGRDIFLPLAERRRARPELVITLCLNVGRQGPADERTEDAILEAFWKELRAEIWTEPPMPEVFFDPRALRGYDGPRGVLHAKCIVVDGIHSLISSANFTEAAQDRNVEVGVRVSDPDFAAALEGHFRSLMEAGVLRRLAR